MVAVLAFLRTPLGRDAMLALAVLGFLLGIYGAGIHHEKKSEAGRVAKAAAVVAKREAKAAQISSDARASLETKTAEIRTRTVTLIKKVPVYVPAAADRECSVNRGFVRLYNAAASGVSGGSGGPDETAADNAAPSDVPLSTVGETSVTDLGVAYQWREEAMTWRQWYADQSKTWGKR